MLWRGPLTPTLSRKGRGSAAERLHTPWDRIGKPCILSKTLKQPQCCRGQARWEMKTLLAIVGDGTAAPLLETALLVARRFQGRIVGLNALTSEYAVVFGGEMGFSISSEV